MIAPVLLLGLAVAVAVGGSHLLATASWSRRAPRLGVAMWQAASWCVVASVVLAGLSLAIPSLPPRVTSDVASYLGACVVAVRQHYATPWGAAATTMGLMIVVAVTARVGLCLMRSMWTTRRVRARSLDDLAFIAERDAATGVLIVDYPQPAVFCIPGRRGAVVVTRGALSILGADEMASVLAHEQAHLRGRHDLAVTAARALRAAFPFVPLFRQGAVHIPALVEMHADDRALLAADRGVLARALVRLAGGGVPHGALGATGGPALARVHRLVGGRQSIGPAHAVALAAGLLLLLTGPVALAVAPAVEASLLDYCPLILSS